MLDGIVHGNVAFIILSTVLVFIMTPGLAFFYGGLVERKNSLTIMLQVFLAIGVVTIMWIFGGFSLVFGDDIGGFIGNPAQFFAFRNLDFVVNRTYGLTIPFLMFFMYQLMFAIITLPLMTGAIANRMRVRGWIVFLIIWMIIVYFPIAHWIWGGGFLAKMGFVDFAGGTVIHVSSGFSGLAAIYVLGRRAVPNDKGPFNLGLVAIGAALLLFGWFGFNAGGTLAAAETAAIVFTNTGVAGAAGMVVWTIISYIEEKRFSFLEPLIGAVAGLATITPASGYVTPLSATLIGAIAGAFCFFCVKFAKKRFDDALDVWGVHGMGGFIGTILIGFLANRLVNGINAGVEQILIQLFGAVIVAIYSIIVTFIIMKIIDRGNFIRVSKEEQERGLDESLLHEKYDIE
ncbi:MAG: ammonium transporter [Clostridium sp.]|uniref:ammonium transporter n=1 Tax=Clostridium sp. TaxID=1506 RepID=UPI003EE5EE93